METDIVQILWRVAELSALVLTYIILILLSTALTESSRSRLEEMVARGFFGARSAIRVVSQAEGLLLVLQSIRFFLVLAFGVVLAILVVKLDDLSIWSSIPQSGFFGPRVLVIVTLAVASIAAVLASEVAKAFVAAFPERVLCIGAVPMCALAWLCRPLAAIVHSILDPLLRVSGLVKISEREVPVSAQEISELVEISSEAGEIEDSERAMIQGVFDLSETLVSEVMTPRKDIVAVSETVTLDEVLKILISEGLSRLLVTGDNLDDVKGVLMAKDLMPFVGILFREFDVTRLMREPYKISGSKRLAQALHELRRNAVHLAVVLDEHGGVDGVVTVEDFLEELVGDIFDEYDVPEDELEHRRAGTGDIWVDGTAAIDDLNEAYGFGFPPGEYDSIAGFVMQISGRIPVTGETIDYNGWQLRMEEVVDNRIMQIRIARPVRTQ